MHEQPQMAAESGMVDDGKGAKEIFRVDKFDLLQVSRKIPDQPVNSISLAAKDRS